MDSQRSLDRSSPTPERTNGIHRILSVDDEPAIRYTREVLLQSEGYEVLSAPDGPHAVALFSENPIDLVLLDYVMPGMDGGSVAQEIRRISPQVPIIMVTANPLVLDKCSCANCVVTKGWGPAILLDKMRELLAEASSATAESPAAKQR